jgi:hypothetical protein
VKKNTVTVSPVTKGGHNVQIFSSPKSMRPEIMGAVTVSFKHEDEFHDMAVGPVVVTAVEPYDAWVKIHGTLRINACGETRYLIPFGSVPEGRHDLGWVTKLVAKEIAGHYGAALKEF